MRIIVTQTAADGSTEAILFDEAIAVSVQSTREVAIANLVWARTQLLGIGMILHVPGEPPDEAALAGDGLRIICAGGDEATCRAWLLGQRDRAVAGPRPGPVSALVALVLSRPQDFRLTVVDLDGGRFPTPDVLAPGAYPAREAVGPPPGGGSLHFPHPPRDPES